MIRGAVRAASCAVALYAAPASAKPVQFAIPDGFLGEAAITVGRQANISISVSDPALSASRVHGIRGRLTPEAAIRRLIATLPARLIRLAPNAFRIEPVRRSHAPYKVRTARASTQHFTNDEDPILVTATKRPMPARDVPALISVLDFEDMAKSELAGGSEILARHVAALSSTHLGPGRNKIFIRGIADSSFNGQTQATVGQYLGEARLNYNSVDPDLRLYDLRSAEILPGPQGTLYGAGTIGGVIRLNPTDPKLDCFCGSVQASVALTAHGAPSRETAGIFNLPFGDGRAAARIVGYAIEDGGYIDNVFRRSKDVNRVRTSGARTTVKYAISSATTVKAMFLGQRIEAADSQYSEQDVGPLSRATPFAEPFSSKFLLGNLTLETKSGPYRMIATASAADQRVTETFSASRADVDLILSQISRSRIYSGELRVSRDWHAGGGWLAGLSLVKNERNRSDDEHDLKGIATHPDLRNRVEEATIFGELTRPLFGSLEATVGARVTNVRTVGDLQNEPKLSSSELRILPSVALSMKISPDFRLFARIQDSYRPGGYVLRRGSKSEHLDSDYVRSWEGGARFERVAGFSIRGGLSASYSKWSRVQVDLIDSDGFPSTTNFGSGQIWSIDGHVEATLMPALSLEIAAVRNWSRLTDKAIRFGFSPSRPAFLPNVPDFSGQLNVRSLFNLGGRQLKLSEWARYVGKSTLGIGPGLDRTQGDYLETGIEADLALPRFTLSATLTNLFDSAGNRFALGSLLASDRLNQVTPMRPRTLRIGAIATF